MAFLVPFALALPPTGKVHFRGLILSETPGIPDGSYQFEDWYCPNPACDCFQGLLEVWARQPKSFAARVYVPFTPGLAPFLDPEDAVTPTKLAWLDLLTQHLQADPAYRLRLQEHYGRVRSVARNPQHPAYPALKEWAANGPPAAPTSKPKRKRH